MIRSLATAILLVVALAVVLAAPAAAQQATPVMAGPHAAPTTHIQVGALPLMDTTPAFDAEAATRAYLAKVSGAAREKSDAYTEGGHGLLVVDLVYALVVAGLLLWLQISARIRDWAEGHTRSHTYQVMIYVAAYVLIVTAAEFPLSVYEGFLREHAYGLSNQSFAQWLGDFGIGLAVTLAASLIVLPVIYAAIRAARENWWLWGAGITIFFFVIFLVIYPVFVAPLFNHYGPLPDSPLRQDILSLARANGIAADNVWLVDESRQSTRLSANVTGFLGTTRISLNDNLLKHGSHDEVLAVLGHEMGHYVMGHTTRLLLLMGLVAILGFAFMAWGFRFAVGVFGGNWQVREVSDIAGLPLLAALASLYLFVMTPALATISRTTEQQADYFGVNAVRKPDAFATVILKLATYRKLEPGPWEEAIFYDHPSGRTRIHTMMVWKKEHIGDADIRDTAKLP
ncbi:MAG TPA: M48 family metallopeptidase [Rhizomicrobium sp.]|nr:M48 family metallopeptidase [Rhizomicrobium sp.]